MVTAVFIVNGFTYENAGAFGFVCQNAVNFDVTLDNSGSNHSTYIPDTQATLYLPARQYYTLLSAAHAGGRVEIAYQNSAHPPYKIATVNILQLFVGFQVP